jgi:uridine kinase
MTVDRQFIRIQKRDRGGKQDYERSHIEKAIGLAARQMGGFQRFITPEAKLGQFVMLDYRGKSDAEIIHSITDKVEMKLDSANQFPLAVNAPLKFANQQYMPAIEDIQDAIIYTLWESGFVDIAEYYLFYRSAKGLLRSGELRENQLPFMGYPNETFRKELIARYEERNCRTIEQVNELVDNEVAFKNLIDDFTHNFDADLLNAFSLFKAKAQNSSLPMCIIISGKSSSGKTTTTKRFCDLVEREGYTLLEFPVDEYFTQDQPVDTRGDIFYELPESLDLELLHRHLHELLVERKAIELPHYDFKTNTSTRKTDNWIKLEENQVLVIDSHQGLFLARKAVRPEQKFAIYLEPWNPVIAEAELAHTEYVSRGLFNMLGRWLRDRRLRGTSYEFNIPHWQKVRLGELRDIVPRMNEADVQINTGFPFAGNYFSYGFKQPNCTMPEPQFFLKRGQLYGAIRCLQAQELLSAYKPVPKHYMSPDVLPAHSVLREFIGGSCYEAK